jgi:hypothetical protein
MNGGNVKPILLAYIAAVATAYGAVNEDMNIRTWVVPVPGFNLKTTFEASLNASNPPAGFSNDKIVGVKTVVYSDPNPNNDGMEVFNFVRQSGTGGTHVEPNGSIIAPNNKSGGWYSVFAYDFGNTNRLFIDLQRKLSGAPDFYESDYPVLSNIVKRTFTGYPQKRASMKLEYVCTSNCPAPSTNVLWMKIGTWQMEARYPYRSMNYNLSAYAIPSLNFVDMTAAIQSDPLPGTADQIQVDDLEHVSQRSIGPWPYESRLRGGILWYGYGCQYARACNDINGPQKFRLHLYGGPTFIPSSATYNGSTYTQGGYQLGPDKVIVPYAGTQNRGWIRMEYTGNKSSVPVPYAVKTKAVDIGPWNMTESPWNKMLTFSSLGMAANRVMRLATVIRKDYSNCGTPLPCQPGYGYEYKNFHAPMTFSGQDQGAQDTHGVSGGNTYIDESRDGIFLNIASMESKYIQPGGGYSDNSPSNNRGTVLIDYLMGSCEKGLAGFQIQAIPGTQVGDCSANASPFTFEAAGGDVWNNADNFTYMNSSTSGDIDIQVKIESQTAAQGWAKSGLMIRENLTAGAREASMLVTPSNGAHFNFRLSNPGATDRTPCEGCTPNAIKAPYYLRLVKTGLTFTAYARQNSTNAWGPAIGTKTMSSFPTTFYYGLAQNNFGDKNLAKSTFSGFTTAPVSGSYYKVLNKNSGKSLDVAGASLVNGGNVDQWAYTNADQEKWQFVDLGTGYWKIVNKKSGLVLDVNGASTADGANVQQWGYSGGTNQQWQIVDLGNGVYKLLARHSGKALEVSGGSTADGANVRQWTYQSGTNQQWQILGP